MWPWRKNDSKKSSVRKGDGPALRAKKKKASAASSVSPKRGASANTKKRLNKKEKELLAKKQKRSRRRRILSALLSTSITLFIALLFVLIYFASTLPSIDELNTIKKQPSVTMKTADGIVIASYGDVYGEYIRFDELPEHLVHAVLATEDRRFFDHFGIDLFGIARAMVVNIQAGRLVQGGSTITQQVAKNVFLTPERTLTRKLQEMLLSFWLESKFTKQEILEIYLNRVYLGSGNYGIDAAAQRYFGKSAREIDLVESAILTGLLKAPSRYSPLASLERAKKRAHQVLLNMVNADYLQATSVEPALASFDGPATYREGDASGTRYFTDWIMDSLPDYVNQSEEDLIITTTLNPSLQADAEDIIRAAIEEAQEEKLVSQSALISMTPGGAIRAMVGGVDYGESQFNRATQASRQPGSVFKLFVYLAALDAGIPPDILIDDAPIEMQVGRRIWRPKNFGHEYRGLITMKEALTHSINTVAVQLADAVGVQNVADMARRLGIPDIMPAPSIALGAVETQLINMTAAYAHLANQGRGVKPYGILRITTTDGEELYRHTGSGLWVVLRTQVVHAMNDMLMNVVREGTGRGASIGRDVAGKTGTSSDFKDAWFIGYTPQLVTGVWVGNDDNSAMKKVTGGNVPARIWRKVMTQALSGKAARALPVQLDDSEENNDRLPWQSEEGLLEDFLNAEPQTVTEEPKTKSRFWENWVGDSSPEHDYPRPGGNHR